MGKRPARDMRLLNKLYTSCNSSAGRWYMLVLAAGRALRARPLLSRCMQLAGIVLLTWLLLGDNLKAEWGPIDDHEIMGILGDREQLSLAEVVTALRWHPEVGKPSFASKRYRPAYYTLRYLEAFAWGDSVRLWYAARLALFAASVWLFWQVLCPWLGEIGSAAAVLWMLTLRFWPDIWCKLGPAEIYAACGTALCLHGAASLCRALQQGREMSRLAVGILVIGALIAVGSKENFLVLAPVCWILAGWCCWVRRPNLPLLGGTALITLWGSWIAWVVFAGIRQDALDIYCDSVDAASGARALGLLAKQLTTSSRLLPVVLALVLLPVAYLTARRRESFQRLLPVVRSYGILMLALIALFVSQFLFYRGRMPGTSRYNFPGVLALPLLWIALACLGLQFLRVWRHPWFRVARVALLGLLVARIAWSGFGHFEQAAAANLELTTAFSNEVRELVEVTRGRPGVPVVIFSQGSDDYEKIFSLQQYLYRYRVANPLYLVLENAPRAREMPALNRCLLQRLSSISKEGGNGYQPLGRLDRHRPFLEVCLGQARGPRGVVPSRAAVPEQAKQSLPADFRSQGRLASDLPAGKEQP